MTSVDEPRPMRRYLVIMATTFFILIATLAIPLVYFGSVFGALATPAQLAGRQLQRPETIVLPFDLRYNGAFKLQRVEQERPEIIWFSSSRAGEMSASLFMPGNIADSRPMVLRIRTPKKADLASWSTTPTFANSPARGSCRYRSRT